MTSASECSARDAGTVLAMSGPALRRLIWRHGTVGPTGIVSLEGVSARRHGREIKFSFARRWRSRGQLVPWLSTEAMAGVLGETYASLSKRLQPKLAKRAKTVRHLTVRGRKIVARMFGGRWKHRFDDLEAENVPC